MSRQRFNELVEGYARGELDSSQAREFLVLVQQNDSWATESEETRELVRLARLAPKPTAPAGLLHGALAKARATAQETAHSPDTTPSANVIILQGSGGSTRRIPIHTENAPTTVAQGDPQLRHHWRHYNWGMVAAGFAVLVIGGVVAMEIGPALFGKRTARVAGEDDVRYLATSTIHEIEELAAGRPEIAPRGPGVGFSADLGRQVAQRALAQDYTGLDPSLEPAMSTLRAPSPTLAPAPMSMYQDSTRASSLIEPAPDLSAFTTEMADSDRAEEAVFLPSDLPNMIFERPAVAAAPAPIAPADEQAEVAYLARSTAQQTTESEVDVPVTALDTYERTEVADATPTPEVIHLSPLEVDFILAQARVTGGGEARPQSLGFAPLPAEEPHDAARTELAMFFPDRGSYESFLTRLRITPLTPMQPADGAALSRTRSTNAVESRSQAPGRSSFGAFGGRDAATPSPVTGLAAPTTARQGSSPQPASAVAWEMAAAASESKADQVEIGKPLDLSRYRMHLTTDVQTGQVRVTLRPLQQGELPNGAPAPQQSPSPPPGARR